MTLGVYAQLLKLGNGNVQALETVMGCTCDEARAIFESEDLRALDLRTISERPEPRPSKGRPTVARSAVESAPLQEVQKSG